MKLTRGLLSALLSATVVVVLGIASAPRAHAQTGGTLGWFGQTILSDTLALGAMDSTVVVDMTNHRYVMFRVKVLPPAGAAEPWSEVVVGAVGCWLSRCDSSTAARIDLQPVADRSWIASATGDSTAYGSFSTVNRLQRGAGEVLVRGQRDNVTFPYPMGYWLTLAENKGQSARVRYLYLRVRHTADGASGATSYCKVIIDALRSN